MMTYLIARLIALGIPKRFAAPLLGLLALIAVAGALWTAIALHDRHVIAASDAQHEAKLAPVIAKAGDNAATQRSADTIAITRHEQEIRNDIHATPDQAPAPSSLVLGCDRLYRQGKNLARIPACAGLASSH
jgi:hypothetical protein